jgi:hypothetical protein
MIKVFFSSIIVFLTLSFLSANTDISLALIEYTEEDSRNQAIEDVISEREDLKEDITAETRKKESIKKQRDEQLLRKIKQDIAKEREKPAYHRGINAVPVTAFVFAIILLVILFLRKRR